MHAFVASALWDICVALDDGLEEAVAAAMELTSSGAIDYRWVAAAFRAAGALSACNGVITDQDGAVTLAWDAPTTNADGTPLTDLAGYRLYIDSATPVDGAGGNAIDVGDVTQYALQLTSGTHYIAVRAYDAESLESGFSNELTIQVP